jgi:hypothetical protein
MKLFGPVDVSTGGWQLAEVAVDSSVEAFVPMPVAHVETVKGLANAVLVTERRTIPVARETLLRDTLHSRFISDSIFEFETKPGSNTCRGILSM